MKHLISFLLILQFAGCVTTTHPIQRLSTSRIDHFIEKDRLSSMKGQKVAVLPFSTTSSDLGWQYAEEFSLFMGKLKHFNMIERLQVQKLFDEQDFDPQRIDDTMAIKIGKMLGAKGVVIGSISDYVNARLVDTETGAHIWNARLTLDKEASVSASIRRRISVFIVATLCEASLGIVVIDGTELSPEEQLWHNVREVVGAVVADIQPNSEAKEFLQVGDVIRAVDGTLINDSIDVVLAMFGKNVGEFLNLTIIRGKETLNVRVRLIQRTD